MNKTITKVVKTKSWLLATFYGVFYCFGCAEKINHKITRDGDTAVKTAMIIKTKIRVIIAAIKYVGIIGNLTNKYKIPIIKEKNNAIKRAFSTGSFVNNSGKFNETCDSIKNENAKIIEYPIITEAI